MSGAPARGVEPPFGAGELGGRAEVREAGRGRLSGPGLGGGEPRGRPQGGEPALDRVGVLERSRRVDQERREAPVPGQRLLEADVEVRGHQHPGEQQHGTECALDDVAPGAATDPLEHRARAERVEEQNRAEADGVGDRHRDDPGRGAARGAHRGDGGQDRAGARRAHEAERGADAETGARSRSRAFADRSGRAATAAPGRARRARARAARCRSRSAPRSPAVRAAPPAIPTPLTSWARATIAIVNVTARPRTIPNGLRRPPVALADSSAGRTGRTHGVIAVPAPAIRANTISSSMRGFR